jgi:hypothetical protein
MVVFGLRLVRRSRMSYGCCSAHYEISASTHNLPQINMPLNWRCLSIIAWRPADLEKCWIGMFVRSISARLYWAIGNESGDNDRKGPEPCIWTNSLIVGSESDENAPWTRTGLTDVSPRAETSLTRRDWLAYDESPLIAHVPMSWETHLASDSVHSSPMRKSS